MRRLSRLEWRITQDYDTMARTLYDIVTTTSIGVWNILADHSIRPSNIALYIAVYEAIRDGLEQGRKPMELYDEVGKRFFMEGNSARKIYCKMKTFVD